MANENVATTPLDIDGLGKRFVQTLLAIDNTITSAISQALWQDIRQHYNEAHRAYHNLSHLKQLFIQFDDIKQHLQQPYLVALALYYHDVIYDPTRTDNEAKSAGYAVEQLQSYLNAKQCQRICTLIMMTAAHQLSDNTDRDAAYLLDMDLSILGAPWANYKKYAQAVRQEYAHVSDAEYCTGRASVLNSLLAHPALYLTDYYYSRLEKQARANIKREIILLRAS